MAFFWLSLHLERVVSGCGLFRGRVAQRTDGNRAMMELPGIHLRWHSAALSISCIWSDQSMAFCVAAGE
jgi:hypothetical protein